MIAKVAPAVKLPRLTWDFDYLIEDDLEIQRGSLVEIPWRGKKVVGVVLETVEQSDIPRSKLKPITGLLTEDRLPEDVMKALEWAAERYLSSPGLLVKRFLPTPPKRRLLPSKDLKPIVASEQLNLSKKWGQVRLYGSPQEKWLVLEEAVERCLKTGHSVIVLAPHQEDIKDAVHVLKKCSGDRLVEIHGKLAAGKLWRNWEAALTGQAAVIVGSRLASMTPVKHLGLIVILEGDSLDHKQYDQNPRYDARSLARIRTDTAGAELLLMTQAPRAEEMSLIKDGFKLEEGALRPASVVLVDMSAWGKEWTGPLSPASVERIRKSLQNNKKTLIYHNRHGMAGALACADCRFVMRCPTCSLAMSVRKKELYCSRCGQSSEHPTSCPECEGVRLHPIGWGTTAIKSHIKEMIPEATVAVVDAETRVPDKLPAADILIGSKGLVHDLAERHGGDYGTVIVTAAEDLLRHSGFRTTEEAWALIRKLRYLAAQGETELTLQTLSLDDPKVRSLTRELKPFLYDELSARKQSGYPPIGRLILIVARGKTEETAQNKALEARELLKASCKSNGPKTILSQPFRPSQPISHGYWRQAIAIKAPAIGPELFKALRQLPEEFIIDPDPETPI